MRGSRIALVVIAVVSVVVLAVVASSGDVQYAERWPSVPWENSEFEVAPSSEATETQVTPIETEADLDDESQRAADVFGIVLLGLALLALFTMVSRRRGGGVRWRQPRRSGQFQLMRDRLDEVSDAVERDAVAQRELLLAGEPRNAIVQCWQRLESLLVDVGVERLDSDTSTDLVTRALGRHDVDADALTSFAALYREARFSTHPMGEPERRAALAALDSLHTGLRARHSTDPLSMT